MDDYIVVYKDCFESFDDLNEAKMYAKHYNGKVYDLEGREMK